jgi:AraC family transcriptional regulator
MDDTSASDREQRIRAVKGHILEHLDQDLSLSALAEVAHWSPLHLQRAFKKATGITPKRYVLRARLTLALRDLMVHPHRTITEVALSHAFPSVAEFSRATRSFFQLSPRALRALPPMEVHLLLNDGEADPHVPPSAPAGDWESRLRIALVDVRQRRGCVVLDEQGDPAAIPGLFARCMELFTRGNIAFNVKEALGIACPHPWSPYRAFIPLPEGARPPKGSQPRTIAAGRYVSFHTQGGLQTALHTAHHVQHRWLKARGLRFKDIIGFETFAGDPSSTPYEQNTRVFHLPVERI